METGTATQATAGASGQVTVANTHMHNTISLHKTPGLVSINHAPGPVIVNSLAEAYI